MWSSKVEAYRKLSSSSGLHLLILLSPGEPAWPGSMPRLLGGDVRKQGGGMRAAGAHLGGRHLSPSF